MCQSFVAMEFSIALRRLTIFNTCSIPRLGPFVQRSKNIQLFSSESGTDRFLDNLILELGEKREKSLLKYIEGKSQNPTEILYQSHEDFPFDRHSCKLIKEYNLLTHRNIKDLVRLIERNINHHNNVPNGTINYLLVYFAKNGDVSGIKALQLIIKKYNVSDFNLKSEYNHYLAEALWINGRIEESLKLFIAAYDNSQLRDKIKWMLKSLFPLLTTHHGNVIARKTVYAIEHLSSENDGIILLGCLWKELFLSNWFSDQQLSNQILQRNCKLLEIIQWMIPTMGKELLKNHKVEDFYRLFEFTLINKLRKFERILLRLLFDYHYVQHNLERCSAVVKYSITEDSPLTEEQHRRYVNLLLNCKDSAKCKMDVKIPENLKYKF